MQRLSLNFKQVEFPFCALFINFHIILSLPAVFLRIISSFVIAGSRQLLGNRICDGDILGVLDNNFLAARKRGICPVRRAVWIPSSLFLECTSGCCASVPGAMCCTCSAGGGPTDNPPCARRGPGRGTPRQHLPPSQVGGADRPEGRESRRTGTRTVATTKKWMSYSEWQISTALERPWGCPLGSRGDAPSGKADGRPQKGKRMPPSKGNGCPLWQDQTAKMQLPGPEMAKMKIPEAKTAKIELPGAQTPKWSCHGQKRPKGSVTRRNEASPGGLGACSKKVLGLGFEHLTFWATALWKSFILQGVEAAPA